MVSSLSKAVGRCGRLVGKQPGKNRVQDQVPGSVGVPRRLATWSKTGWELENFFPWVEMPPLHFEGIEQTRGHRERQGAGKMFLLEGILRKG